MLTDKMKQDLLSKLNDIPIPSHEIKVFGSIRANIHIICESIKTAEKWNITLHKFCSSVKVVETVIYNKENQNTCLLPSRRKGYLVGAVI